MNAAVVVPAVLLFMAALALLVEAVEAFQRDDPPRPVESPGLAALRRACGERIHETKGETRG